MEYLRAFTGNPKNPKLVKIPYETFLIVTWLFGKDPSTFSVEEKALCEIAMHELNKKRNSIVNRQNYSAMKQAQTESEIQAAYENYRLSKEFAKSHRG